MNSQNRLLFRKAALCLGTLSFLFSPAAACTDLTPERAAEEVSNSRILDENWDRNSAEQAAIQGDRRSAEEVIFYYNNKGDQESKLKWYRIGVRAGSAAAMEMLAGSLRKGGSPADCSQAADLFRQASRVRQSDGNLTQARRDSDEASRLEALPEACSGGQ